MYCVSHENLCVSCSAELKKKKKTAKDDTGKSYTHTHTHTHTHTPPYGPAHTKQTDRETVRAQKRFFCFFSPPNRWEKWRDAMGKRDVGRWRLHAVTHQRKGQRGGSCHIASESAAATPALPANTLLLLGEERRGEERRGEERRGGVERNEKQEKTSPFGSTPPLASPLQCVSFQLYLIPHLRRPHIQQSLPPPPPLSPRCQSPTMKDLGGGSQPWGTQSYQ